MCQILSCNGNIYRHLTLLCLWEVSLSIRDRFCQDLEIFTDIWLYSVCERFLYLFETVFARIGLEMNSLVYHICVALTFAWTVSRWWKWPWTSAYWICGTWHADCCCVRGRICFTFGCRCFGGKTINLRGLCGLLTGFVISSLGHACAKRQRDEWRELKVWWILFLLPVWGLVWSFVVCVFSCALSLITKFFVVTIFLMSPFTLGRPYKRLLDHLVVF